ncbi:unnamed protein product [Zymoseptoria tritici ST99CH_3D1]|nr:unnamed protein product [Zymoseptoria tritici ST99CH_3D1]
MLSTLTLLLATIASLTAAACTSTSPSASAACYTSTTTVLDPTCTPWTGICPLMLCATPTATATAVVPLVTPHGDGGGGVLCGLKGRGWVGGKWMGL